MGMEAHYVLDTLERNSLIYDIREQGMAQGIVLGKEQGRIETIKDTVRLLREHDMNADQIESIRTSLLNMKGEA